MQLSLFGLLLLTQPLHSSEQHTRANLEFSSNFAYSSEIGKFCKDEKNVRLSIAASQLFGASSLIYINNAF
mgnify:FL=1